MKELQAKSPRRNKGVPGNHTRKKKENKKERKIKNNKTVAQKMEKLPSTREAHGFERRYRNMDVVACTTRVCQCLYHYTIPEIATLRRVHCSSGFRLSLEREADQRGSCRGVCINYPCKESSRHRGSHRYDPRSRTTRTSPRRLASLRKHPKTVKLILPCTHP